MPPITDIVEDPFMAETEIAKLRTEIERLRACNNRLYVALKILYEDRTGFYTRADAFDVARRALDGTIIRT